MAKGGLPELLNYKQKGKDMNEFIKVPMSEKLAYCFGDRKSTRLNSSHSAKSRMPSSA